jgi:hypothetical protein
VIENNNNNNEASESINVKENPLNIRYGPRILTAE